MARDDPYLGRLHRLFHSKREVRVYDYADLNVPMLARMFDRRCRRYEGIGYTIQLPGSAVPGWPADVPLPIDPDWKSQYAASVRRLVRDGLGACRGEVRSEVQGIGFIGKHSEFVEGMAR